MSREVKQTDLPPLPRSPRRDKIVVPKTSLDAHETNAFA